jgi:ApaG protein
MYRQTTRNIEILVVPTFLDSHSSPEDHVYVWAYEITIINNSKNSVQLLNRHWKITDGYGRLQEVRGPGVVGEQPTIESGQSYRYTSGAHLATPSGIMQGSYEMHEPSTATLFYVEIPPFSLDIPNVPLVRN